MRLETHSDTITQLRVRIKSVWQCHLNSFLAIIRSVNEERFGVCVELERHKSYKLFRLYMG